MLRERNYLNIESNFDFYQINSKEDFNPFLLHMRNELIKYYPSFDKWFDSLFNGYNKLNVNRLAIIIVNTQSPCTNYQVIKNGEIQEVAFCGVMILKTRPTQKICTLWLHPKHRHQGIGSMFIEKALKIFSSLQDIIITCPLSRIHYFQLLLHKFGFENCRVIADIDKYIAEESVFIKNKKEREDMIY